MDIRIHFGPQSPSALADALRDRQIKRLLVVTGASRRFVDQVIAAVVPLGIETEVFDGAVVHVPVEVVSRAREVVDRFRPDAFVSLGGGAATGLVKALRREYEAAFFALPTTFSASEMTSIFGITDGQKKETGRDPKVRPDAVFYDSSFVVGLPLSLKVTSLMNALAHPISALSTGSLDQAGQKSALDAIRLLVRAVLQIVETPEQTQALEDGLRGASRAGQVLESSQLGVHHRMAHWLGGRFSLEHSALHSVLLPQSLRTLYDDQPAVAQAIEEAAQVGDLPAQLFDLLRRSGAKTSLRDMDVPYGAFMEAQGSQAELSKDVLQAAFHGRRPSLRVRHEDWGLRQPVAVAAVALGEAETVVVAVHGRSSSAEAVLGRVFEVVGHGAKLAVIAPQAPNGEWYSTSYREPADKIGPALNHSLDEIERVVTKVRQGGTAKVVLFGFSQGACVACEYVASRSARPDVLVAPGGARIGPREAYAPITGALQGLKLLLGVADQDPWVSHEDVNATAEAFRSAGADAVHVVIEPGNVHQISGRQRILARTLILDQPLQVLRGFGNAHETEALPGALPTRMNSPRIVRHQLYAEQINGTGFVAQRHENLRSWTYRIRHTAQHTRFERFAHPTFLADYGVEGLDPNLMGYAPLPVPEAPTDFIDGMATFGGAGRPELRRGFAVHLYAANRSMDQRAFSNSDGDLLIVPQLGALTLVTEMGVLDLPPGSIGIVPRGIRFSVLLNDGVARGYVAEVYGRHFELPERGPVGANGLTEARHFVSPQAWYEDRLHPGYRLVNKFCGRLYEAKQDYSPYDVVAWHGNYSPYVYDLMDFGPVSNVRFDHPDPSIYTVLSAPMDEQGSNTLDFVFFPPRWDVTEGTFRPPFFHRNATTEFNGIIKDPGGDKPPFYAGGYFMTPSMTPHGVMADSVLRAWLRKDDPKPHRSSESSMWFQFESALPISLTPWAQASANRMDDWHTLWGTYRTHFRPA